MGKQNETDMAVTLQRALKILKFQVFPTCKIFTVPRQFEDLKSFDGVRSLTSRPYVSQFVRLESNFRHSEMPRASGN